MARAERSRGNHCALGSTICVSGWTATVRPSSSYTTALKRLQIDQYGYSDHRLGDYEEDHLISLELGGATRDPRNLWPEPYTVKLSDGRAVGARIKDKIENRLHSLVCAGQISLAKAQREIRLDWITAWFALDGEAPPPAGSGTSKPSPKPTPQPAVGSLKVMIASVTSPVSRGASATLVARTKAGASCAVVVLYPDLGFAAPLASAGAALTYAVYLWHVDLIRTFGVPPGVLAALVVASVSYLLIERPVLRAAIATRPIGPRALEFAERSWRQRRPAAIDANDL